MSKLSRYRKTVLGLLGALATWAMGTYPTNMDVQRYGGLVLALLTAVGVYAVRNTPPAGEPSDPNISETDPQVGQLDGPEPPEPSTPVTDDPLAHVGAVADAPEDDA